MGLDVGEAVVADLLDRGEGFVRLPGALFEHVQADACLHADGGHRVPEDVVQLARDAQPLLGREPPCPLLAALDLLGELGPGDREHRPVVAHGRARAGRRGRQQHGDRDDGDRLGVGEHHADRDDRDQRRGQGSGKPPPPAPLDRERVAADQRDQGDQPARVAAGEPDQACRVERDQHRHRVAPPHRDRSGDHRSHRDRSGVDRACARPCRRPDPGDRGREEPEATQAPKTTSTTPGVAAPRSTPHA